MKNIAKVCCVLLCLSLLSFGCASQQKHVEKEMNSPINCATAIGDIRMLEHEKAHVEEQIGEGVTAIFPAGAVVGIVTGTEGTKLKVATGDYNKMIDKRIKEIRETCDVPATMK